MTLADGDDLAVADDEGARRAAPAHAGLNALHVACARLEALESATDEGSKAEGASADSAAAAVGALPAAPDARAGGLQTWPDSRPGRSPRNVRDSARDNLTDDTEKINPMNQSF